MDADEIFDPDARREHRARILRRDPGNPANEKCGIPTRVRVLAPAPGRKVGPAPFNLRMLNGMHPPVPEATVRVTKVVRNGDGRFGISSWARPRSKTRDRKRRPAPTPEEGPGTCRWEFTCAESARLRPPQGSRPTAFSKSWHARSSESASGDGRGDAVDRLGLACRTARMSGENAPLAPVSSV